MGTRGDAPGQHRRTTSLVCLVLIGTALGGWRVASTVTARPDPSALVVRGVSYTVTHVEQVKGLTDADLGGMSHGVQSLVTDDKALVTVSLVVTAGDTASEYDAGVLRAVTAGSSVALPPVGGTLAPGRLRAHARMEGSLSFVVRRTGAQLALRAPGGARSVPLLQVDQAPVGASEHQHPSTAPTTGRAAAPDGSTGRQAP